MLRVAITIQMIFYMPWRTDSKWTSNIFAECVRAFFLPLLLLSLSCYSWQKDVTRTHMHTSFRFTSIYAMPGVHTHVCDLQCFRFAEIASSVARCTILSNGKRTTTTLPLASRQPFSCVHAIDFGSNLIFQTQKKSSEPNGLLFVPPFLFFVFALHGKWKIFAENSFIYSVATAVAAAAAHADVVVFHFHPCGD